MASVFLSYDREDTSKARSIAAALEKAGHNVWWDRHIKGGAQYSEEIEQALKKAEAVVVLWSPASVKSAWVRDEAAAGRDSGRLVPALIDAVDPPMGFRQYQTIDLTRWKGKAGAKPAVELFDAISALGSDEGTPDPQLGAQKPRFRSIPRWAWTILLAALVLAGAFAAWRYTNRASTPIVSVVAADGSAESTALARDLFVQLGRLQSMETKPIDLVDQGAASKPDFTFKIGASDTSTQARANVTLSSKNGSLLWSQDFENSASKIADMRQQIGMTAAQVLDCAAQAAAFGGLKGSTLKVYLNGCGTLSMGGSNFRALVPMFEQVTKEAPEFEGGWTGLVMTRALIVGYEASSPNSPEAGALRSAIAQARERFPSMPTAYWAEYRLSGNDFDEKANIISRAKKGHPDDATVLSLESEFFTSIGRLRDAVEKARRSSELTPLVPADQYIGALGWSGQWELAQREIAKAEKQWPGASSVIDAKWRFHLRYGDPKEALRISRLGIGDYSNFDPFLLARLNPTPANVERAIADDKAKIGHSPRAYGYLVQTLAEFGREEEIFRIFEDPRVEDYLGGVAVVFRPPFRRFRQDPRFMAIAARYGLVDYWQKSGKWPDFCFEPDLPYDCKAEAAKLRKTA